MKDGDTTFSYTGEVINTGDGKATWVRIVITVNNPVGNFIAQAFHLADKPDLAPGETSSWRVTFEDEGREIRDLMDVIQTTYDITWTDEE